jgi:methyl-accepting chemotaxis protein
VLLFVVNQIAGGDMKKIMLLPIYGLIKSFGIQGLLYLLLIFCMGVFTCTFYFSAMTLLPAFITFSYVMLGTILVIKEQLIQVQTVIAHINVKNFDHRDVHFDNLVMPPLLAQLLATFRELGRINHHHEERNKEVEYSALQVIETSINVKTNVQKQSDATTSTAAAITEMSQSLVEVNHEISQAHQSSCSAADVASKGKNSLVSLNSAVLDVTERAQNTQERMISLNGLVKNVENITESIQKISQQTNLLALNASIEAARAGELGRGFAVVAEEVRALAERTHDSTNSIVSNINEVLQESAAIVATMSEVVTQAKLCNGKVDEVDNAFSDIEQATQAVQQQMEIISTVSAQQTVATNEISEHISQVVMGAHDNAYIAEQSESVANHLRGLTQKSI